MVNDGNFKQISVNLRPKQIADLKLIRSAIKLESKVKLPVSELMRDAVDQYIRNIINKEIRKTYISNKGW